MKFFNEVKKYVSGAVAIVGGTVGGSALAAAPDFTALSTAADFSTAATAIVAIFGTITVAIIAWKGGKMVLSALRG